MRPNGAASRDSRSQLTSRPITGWKFRRKAMNHLQDSLFPRPNPDYCSGFTHSLAVLFQTQSEETTERHDGGTDDEIS